MRIWDVHPGYLNRQSLLGEHRELHGIASIIDNGRRGYAAHPETRRWAERRPALSLRHGLLAAEMALRGYCDRSPLACDIDPAAVVWPDTYIDEPLDQFALLAGKYVGREGGRMPLPQSPQQLWAQHKYSVMARDAALYRKLGPAVARMPARAIPADLVRQLVEVLRQVPGPGGLRNALQHMWGYVASGDSSEPLDPAAVTPEQLLAAIQQRAVASAQSYLLTSTALSELAVWLPPMSPSALSPAAS